VADDGQAPSVAQGTPAFSANWVASGTFKVVATDPRGVKAFRLTSDQTPTWSLAMTDRGCGPAPATACLTTETLSIPVTALRDGPNVISATATDTDGNSASVVVGTLRVDRSKPTIAGKTGPLSADGAWFDGRTTDLSFTAHDDFSGVYQSQVDLTPAVVARDAFGRQVAGGWGSADQASVAWAVKSGTATNFSVDGSSGKVTVPSGTHQAIRIYPAGGVKDQDVGVDVGFPGLPASGETTGWVVLRYSDFSSYRIGLVLDASGRLLLRGEDSRTGAAVIADRDTGMRYQAGATYRLRGAATGGNPTKLVAKAWKVGTHEPVAWGVSVSDSTTGNQTNAGFGVDASQTTGASLDMNFDTFSATSVTGKATFDSRTATNPNGANCGVAGCPLDFTRPFVWTPAGELEGRHKITLTAFDPLLWSASSTHTVGIDRTPPDVGVTGALKDDATHLSHGGSYGIHVDARDGDASSDATARSGVKGMEVVVTDAGGAEADRWSDEQGCGADSCAMARDYSFDTAAHEPGRYTVRLTVTDRVADAGNQADHVTTYSWPIRVNRPPTLTVSGSLYDQRSGWLRGQNYDLGFDAADEDLSGGSAELRVDGVLADRQTYSGGTGDWTGSLTFDGTRYDDGTHTVTVVARDADGTTAEKTFDVKVDKTAPSIDLAGSLYVDRDSALEERSYGLDVTAADSGSGAHGASLSVDEQAAGSTDQPCDAGGCGLTHTFSYENSGAAATRAVLVKVTDQAGNEARKEFAAGAKTDVCEQTGTATNTDSAATDRAVDAVEDANPDAVAPSEPTTDEGQTLEPSLTPAGGDNLAATDTLASATVSKDPNDGFAVKRDDTKVCVTPTDTSEDANKGEVVNGDAVVYANTGEDSDTVVRPTSKGVETYTAIRSDDAAEDYSWEVNLEGDQELRKTDDGGIQVVDPTPVANDPGAKPADEPATQGGLDSLQATGEAMPETQLPDSQAQTEAGQSVNDAGTPSTPTSTTTPDSQAQDIITQESGADPTDPPPDAPADDPATAQTTVQQAVDQSKDNARTEAGLELNDVQASATEQNQAAAANENAAEQEAPTKPVVVAEFQPPESKDANGDAVATSLDVSGDTVTMHVDHNADTAYPVVADPWVSVVQYRLVWRCCRPVYRTEWRVNWSQQWNYIGHWWSSWIFSHSWRAHVGWGFWQFYDGWFGWMLMPNYGWSPMYQQQWIPQYYTVQVLDHWEGWLDWEAYTTLEWFDDSGWTDSEELTIGPTEPMTEADRLDLELPRDSQVSAALVRKHGCKTVINPMWWNSALGKVFWTKLYTRWCYDSIAHKAKQRYATIDSGRTTKGAIAGWSFKGDRTFPPEPRAWANTFGGRQIGMHGNSKWEFCPARVPVCLRTVILHPVTWGHDDGTAVSRNYTE
jgi:hypothetical protein